MGALRTIPAGATTSYGSLSKKLAFPQLFALSDSPMELMLISIVVPCHRVIGSNGSLTGYGGGLHRKSWLLKHEEKYAKSPNSSWSDPSATCAMHKLPFADPDHVIESTVTS
jgi:methylated-DNA-[protein]-cysteine S-methyltransferase